MSPGRKAKPSSAELLGSSVRWMPDLGLSSLSYTEKCIPVFWGCFGTPTLPHQPPTGRTHALLPDAHETRHMGPELRRINGVVIIKEDTLTRRAYKLVFRAQASRGASSGPISYLVVGTLLHRGRA